MKTYENYHTHKDGSNVYVPDTPMMFSDYLRRTDELGHLSISCVEHGWVGNYFEYYLQLEKHNKIRKSKQLRPLKWIFGGEFYWVKDRTTKDDSNCHIIILARNENGRKNINRIMSEANKTGYYRRPRLDLELIYSLPVDDVFITTACIAGWKYEDSEDIFLKMANHFDHFYFEVQSHNTISQIELNKRIRKLSEKYNIPMIAGVDSHIIDKSQTTLRDDFLKSKGIVYEDESGWDLDFPDYKTLFGRFVKQGVLDESQIEAAMDSTNDVLKFEDIILDKSMKIPTLYPDLSQEQRDDKFKKLINERWICERKDIPNHLRNHYIEEIRKEVKEIIDCGMSDYFMLNEKIIQRGIDRYGGVLTRTGRGCFTEDSLVHTKESMKSIKDIEIGDFVITKDGKFNKVIDTMKYDIEEEMIQIKHLYGTDKHYPTICTKDHKIYVNRENKNIWVEAEKVLTTDFVCVPKIKIEDKSENVIDLAEYNILNFNYDDNYIYEVSSKEYAYSPREIAERLGVSRSTIEKAIKGSENKLFTRKKNFGKFEEMMKIIPFDTFEEYREYVINNRIKKINRYIKIDEVFNVFVGLMYGDGFTNKGKDGSVRCIGLAINNTTEKDQYNRDVFYKIANSLGTEVYEYRSKTKKLSQLYINSRTFGHYIEKELFKSDIDKSKIFNSKWFYQNKNNLLALIHGLRMSDGSFKEDYRISFDNTSKSIINAYKLLCIMSGEGVNSLSVRKSWRTKDGYQCKESYKLRLNKNSKNANKKSERTREDNDFYYLPVKEIKKLEKMKTTVYDITVENEHNYLLNNMIVHNSGCSEFVNKLLGFTNVDRISSKVTMFPERFLTKERILESATPPDIDHNLASRDEFVQAQKDLLGSKSTYDLIAFGTLKFKSAWKMYARAYDVKPEDADIVSKQITRYDEKLKYAERDEETGELLEEISMFDFVDIKYKHLLEGCKKYLGIKDSRKGHPCFLGNEIVMTDSGYKMIKNISTGDKVLTHNNRYMEVAETMINKSDDIYEIKATGMIPTKVTGNHPYFVRETKKSKKGRIISDTPIWKEVKDLKKGDLLGIAINQKEKMPISEFKLPFENPSFWWTIGRYLGDGWITEMDRKKKRKDGTFRDYTERYLVICCNKNNGEKYDIIHHLDKLGFKYTIQERTTVYRIYIRNKDFLYYLKQFGKYAQHKRLTQDVYDLPIGLLEHVINGYISADGHYCNETKCFKYTSVSKKLALGFANCIAKVYKRHCYYQVDKPKIEQIEDRTVYSKEKYRVSFTKDARKQDRCRYKDGHIWVPFREKEKIEGIYDVYNLSVIDDNSYTVNNVIVHNCGSIASSLNVEEEIGVILCKSETTGKETLTACIESGIIDYFGWLKNDFLVVNVVQTTKEIYDRIGIKPHTMNELLDIIDGDEATWNVYKNGYTLCVNQVEKNGTRKKTMEYKPTNIVELCALIAAVRPSFKSLLKQFLSREDFHYGIKELDELLQTPEMPYSYIFYQEQLMQILGFAGFEIKDTYDIIKSISKKKTYCRECQNTGNDSMKTCPRCGSNNIAPMVEKFKEQFINGFSNKITSSTNKEQVSSAVWEIVLSFASYGFNSSHSYCMALDSVNQAYLKAHYPYEFYETMLRTYTNKGEKDKVLALKEEMKHFGISLGDIKFGEDNRNFIIDKNRGIISQSLVSIKGFSQNTADAIYEISKNKHMSFMDVLNDMNSHKSLKSNHIRDLIDIGYFTDYGCISYLKKYVEVYNKVYNAKVITKGSEYDYVISKYSRETKSQFRDLDNVKIIEEILSYENKEIDISEMIEIEYKKFGESKIFNKDKYKLDCIVVNIDTTYSPKLLLHSLKTGNVAEFKINKKKFEKQPLALYDTIRIEDFEKKKKKKKVEDKFVDAEGFDWWIDSYYKMR